MGACRRLLPEVEVSLGGDRRHPRQEKPEDLELKKLPEAQAVMERDNRREC